MAFSGAKWQDQWLGSRNIAMAKANTALEFSLDSKAISTANLYAGAQPDGFLFGLPLSNPQPPAADSARDAGSYGGDKDPFIGKRAGGVIIFGGGLALYDENGLVGALGVSGDTSCADHNVAWRVRHDINLDHVKAGPNPKVRDEIVYDIGLSGKSRIRLWPSQVPRRRNRHRRRYRRRHGRGRAALTIWSVSCRSF